MGEEKLRKNSCCLILLIDPQPKRKSLQGEEASLPGVTEAEVLTTQLSK